MKKRYFTLVELLVVIGIVVILAGLVLPAVIGGAQQGRITQAKSDMKSIQMALAQMDQARGGKILTTSGSGSGITAEFAVNASTNRTISAKGLSAASPAPESRFIMVGKSGNTVNSSLGADLGDNDEEAYYSLIAELTGTWNYSSGGYLHNVRKVKYLDPNKNFMPDQNYNAAANIPYLWQDPWGNPYTIMINVNGTDTLVKPNNPSSGKYIMSKTAVYSRGPDGEDQQGQNAAEGGEKLHDDIATWHK